jgi:hypothetical protein
MSTNKLDGASQLAMLRAQRAIPGASQDPADYLLPWVKLSGSEFNPADPKYRPELNPDTDFLIGEKPIGVEGVSVIVLGMLSGWEEKERIVIDGHETRRHFAFWRTKPDVTPVKGKGGGLKTDRGGWLTGRFDEIFLLIGRELYVLTLWDMHHIITGLTKQLEMLDIDAMYKVKWRLTKKRIPEGEYTKYEPRFEPISVAGEADGPSEAEIALASKLTGIIRQLSYANPNVPLKLVVGGEPWEDTRETDPNDTGPEPPDDGSDIPEWMK